MALAARIAECMSTNKKSEFEACCVRVAITSLAGMHSNAWPVFVLHLLNQHEQECMAYVCTALDRTGTSLHAWPVFVLHFCCNARESEEEMLPLLPVTV
eukprot:1157894-Pelagomonas_calceolata.AAC.3